MITAGQDHDAGGLGIDPLQLLQELIQIFVAAGAQQQRIHTATQVKCTVIIPGFHPKFLPVALQQPDKHLRIPPLKGMLRHIPEKAFDAGIRRVGQQAFHIFHVGIGHVQHNAAAHGQAVEHDAAAWVQPVDPIHPVEQIHGFQGTERDILTLAGPMSTQVRDQYIVAKAVIEKAGKSGFPLRVAGIAMNPDNRFITLAGIENAL